MSGEPGARYDLPVPEGRRERVEAALLAALEALGLARREAAAGQWRWVALGLVSALQGALVAALSGYETAEVEAVLNPSQADRIAPVALLLRRARSQDYLNPPEQVELSGSRQRALERVLTIRNSAVHALSVELHDTFGRDALAVLDLIRHLVVDAPAFLPRQHRVVAALIRDEAAALERTLETFKPA